MSEELAEGLPGGHFAHKWKLVQVSGNQGNPQDASSSHTCKFILESPATTQALPLVTAYRVRATTSTARMTQMPVS
jgi:hypothetical protein